MSKLRFIAAIIEEITGADSLRRSTTLNVKNVMNK